MKSQVGKHTYTCLVVTAVEEQQHCNMIRMQLRRCVEVQITFSMHVLMRFPYWELFLLRPFCAKCAF